jgi:hypothetical protein
MDDAPKARQARTSFRVLGKRGPLVPTVGPRHVLVAESDAAVVRVIPLGGRFIR